MSKKEDELYEVAKDLFAYLQMASTATIQKELKVDYARAARLMDLLEENGAISSSNGVDPRKVYLRKLAKPPKLPSISPSFHFAGDVLYDDAVDLVNKKGVVSQSTIEQELKIGKARAARLMDIMEQQGVIGPNADTSQRTLPNEGHSQN